MTDEISNYREFFEKILTEATALQASDVHIKVGLPPVVRVHGSLRPINKEAPRLKPTDTEGIAQAIMNPRSRTRFDDMEEVDMGYGVQGSGRFRINIFKQRGTVGLVARAIPYTIRTIDELSLPAVIKKLSMEPRGLVLVTGATGNGKSTTLAAMIQEINQMRTAHIITVEDPIEFLIRDRKSIITQREVSLDTKNFAQALRNALRQDPDVIMVGEMRDEETISIALTAGDTGHLVFSTLHTNDATESINRIVSIFPAHQQQQIRYLMASVLRGVVSQRLVERKDGKGLVAICEVMIVNTRIRECIIDAKKTVQIREAIEESTNVGMQSFDQALMSAIKSGLITYEAALEATTNPADFELRYKGVASMDGAKWNDFDGGIELDNTAGSSSQVGKKGSTSPGDLREKVIEVENPAWHTKIPPAPRKKGA